ncbi:MAG: hypothetical protein GFH27_549309n105 [Chloroflexi bacterium AL-W]|nr:hypothetical protein [Chloroflexi bacterium AL-N1]NOK69807.1 hypothetical protein [Chloroflexi bacterium AL-N10]NOK73589.1 hypothetical protein [Chloroflexi bacterium AL-N5]NOK83977.1 hypothetical protein [Chloroflexi bacterium AL-W]NOK87920.1 hypothetical protein [Chloroflexi bacterium AL-N15]
MEDYLFWQHLRDLGGHWRCGDRGVVHDGLSSGRITL